MSALAPEIIDGIGAVVRARTGFELTRYRSSTIARRIRNRMILAGVSSGPAYLEMLRDSEGEIARLLQQVTLKVSWLYRNRPMFDLLRRRILPELARRRRPLRIWSAGCARGEEPHTLAMLLEEAQVPGEVLATDVDPRALEQARGGHLEADSLRELPPDLRSRYVDESTLELDGGVRQRVRFEEHDVMDGAPGRFDLVCCRNVLIYLKRPFQRLVHANLCNALGDRAVLVLGEAEWPDSSAALEVISRSSRIFRAMPDRGGQHARA